MRRMNPMLRQTLVAVTVFAFLFVQIAGCGGGSSGDRPEPRDSEPLTLSHSRIAPLHFLTIEHPSIEEGQEVVVTFDDGDDFRLSAPATFVSAGTAQIPSPPFLYFDSDETIQSGGSVAVSIENLDASASLRIDPLPSVSGYSPGQLTSWFLELGIGNTQELMGLLTQHSSPNDSHAAQLQYNMQGRMIELQAMRDQFRSGTPVVEFGGDQVALSAAKITLLDQLHLALLNGLEQFAVDHGLLESSSMHPMSTWVDGQLDGYEWVRKTVTQYRDIPVYLQAAGGICGLGLTAVGLVAGTKSTLGIVALTTGLVASFGVFLTSGGTVFFTEGMLHHTDVLEAKGRQTAQMVERLGSVLWHYVSSATLLAGGYQTEGLTRGAFTLAQIWQDGRSVLRIIDNERWPDHPGLRDAWGFGMTVGSAPSELVVGETGTWSVALGGGSPPYTVIFNYGDGTIDSQTGHGTAYSLSHRYEGVDPEGQTFIVNLAARDSEGNTRAQDRAVTVVEGLTAEWVAIPSPLEVNEEGAWSFRVLGGKPPYTVTVDWGDGNRGRGSMDTSGVETTRHAYESARTYNVVFGIQDSLDNSTLLEGAVEVIGIAEECVDLSGRWDAVYEEHPTYDGEPQEVIIMYGEAAISQSNCQIQIDVVWPATGQAGDSATGSVSGYDVRVLVEVEGPYKKMVEHTGHASEDSFRVRGEWSWDWGDMVDHFIVWVTFNRKID